MGKGEWEGRKGEGLGKRLKEGKGEWVGIQGHDALMPYHNITQ